MLQKLDMVIPVDVLGLSGVEIVDIYLRDKLGDSGLIKDFGTSKSTKIKSLPSAFILLGGTAPSQAGCDENCVSFSALLLLYAFTAR